MNRWQKRKVDSVLFTGLGFKNGQANELSMNVMRALIDDVRAGKKREIMPVDLAKEVIHYGLLDRSNYGPSACDECTDTVPCGDHAIKAQHEVVELPVHFAVESIESQKTVCGKSNVGHTTIDSESVTCKQCVELVHKYENLYSVKAKLFKVSPTYLY